MDFPGGSGSKMSAYSAGDPGSIPGSGRFPGEGNGYPLHHSCLENSMDRGAWWARVHGVCKELDRTDWLTHTRSKSWHVSWDLKDNLNFIAAKKDEVHLGTLRGQLEHNLVNLGCACILQTELNRMWQTPGRCYCIWFFFLIVLHYCQIHKIHPLSPANFNSPGMESIASGHC